MSRLERLRRASLHELSWRLRAEVRSQRDRAMATLRRPRWSRGDLPAALAHEAIPASLRRDMERGNWMHVHEGLVQMLRDRPARFVLDPHSAAALRAAILARWPEAGRDAAARARRLVSGEYDLLGYRGLRFDGSDRETDWHLDPVHGCRPPLRFWSEVPYLDRRAGDHKIIWELNRHQHWLALGRAHWLTDDPAFQRVMLDQLASWLRANPPLMGVNWASMLELGLRTLSWTWSLQVLLRDGPNGRDPWLVDLLVALHRQLTHVERNLSHYFSPNTHLIGEALALYVVGQTLPALRASSRWTRVGRSILLAEIHRQVAADGGHVERSTHYHRYTLDFYLLALLVATRAGDAEAVERFTDVVARLARFMRAMTDDRGRMPLIGDDDGGMLWPFKGPDPADTRASLALAAVVLERPELAPWGATEEVYWLAWSSCAARLADMPAGQPSVPSQVFPDTGYAVLRDDRGGHAVFDAGVHGYLNGGHAHADALAITLGIAGRPLLVDPGTATYTMDPALRNRLRCSSSHNTVTLDGRSSSEPAGPFQWRTRTDARLHAWRGNPRFAWAEGMHDGYEANPVRRSVFAGTPGWLIVDQVLGGGPHRTEIHWHFAPDWTVHPDTASRIRARHADGTLAWLLHDEGDRWLARGDASGLGWISPVYGALVAAWSARITHDVTAPSTTVTWICAGTSPDAAPTMERLAARYEPGGDGVAVRMLHDGLVSIVLLRIGTPPHPVSRVGEVGEYRTDGRLLCWSSRGGAQTSLEMTDATYAVARRDDWLSLSADAPVTDLHASLEGGSVHIWASAPPAQLYVTSAALHDGALVLVNGRPCQAEPSARPGTLLVRYGGPGRGDAPEAAPAAG